MHVASAGAQLAHTKRLACDPLHEVDNVPHGDFEAEADVSNPRFFDGFDVIHTRPDICVIVNKLAQVTEKAFTEKHVKQFDTAVKYLKKTKEISLQMKKLDLDNIHIRAYADASFATNYDETSQLGYIVLLSDKSCNANILHFASYKSKRVPRSVSGAETYAFADAFDFAYCAKKDLELILRRKVPLMMFTDSNSLFDVITKCSQTRERRLMIDLQAVRSSYDNHEISDIGFLRGTNNPADGLTKIGKCAALSHLLINGKCNFKIDQWILRNSNNSDD